MKKLLLKGFAVFGIFILLITLSQTDHIPGDVNGDGEVNLKDLLLLRRYILRIDDVPYGDLWRYDVNGDGVVNEYDVEALRNILLGIE